MLVSAKSTPTLEEMSPKYDDFAPRFHASSGAYDLMLSPVFDDDHVPFFAAGKDHSWLVSTKTKGAQTIQAFRAVQLAPGQWTTSPLDNYEFFCETMYNDMAMRNQKADAQFYQYSLHLGLTAAKNAIERSDYATARAALTALDPHIPWLSPLLTLAASLQDNNATNEAGLLALSSAMDTINAWAMNKAQQFVHHDGAIQPWLRSELMMQLIGDRSPAFENTLYAFDGQEGPLAYLWVRKQTQNTSDSKDHGTLLLLDHNMQPLWLQPHRYHKIVPMAAKESDWVIPPSGSRTPNTLAEWKTAMNDFTKESLALHQTLQTASLRKLTPLQCEAAVQAWVDNLTGASSLAWEDPAAQTHLLRWGVKMIADWSAKNPEYAGIVDMLLGPCTQDAGLAHMDAWRNAAKLMTRGHETLALPDLDSLSPTA